MFNDTNNPQRYLLRHPDNNNLSLHYEPTYDGLPVMLGKGPFIREYLSDLKHTIELAMAEYPRVLAFRVDLRLPQGIDLPDYAYTNLVISRFFESFTRRIKYHQGKVGERGYARGCKVRYVWSREVGQGGNPHYHLLILLSRDAYYTVGRLCSERVNMISRMKESWAGALGISVKQVSGLVHISKNAEYRVDRYVRRDDEDELPALFCRASYLCKAATKVYGDGQHGFGASRG
ncbi:inovirus Gp2 family protein [Pseudomonas asiatica]|uniref:inovirus Gp2 family protein n=1 Tax=Pseudomonas asiatica TaxID=2219225 RepID=UPI0018AB36EC|nr:inovirus Gp2 family protein [Pseudomonas asiatica]MBF8805591.1 inovirus Gp2 family protein [Pseudomonas asiatica]